MEKTNLKNIFFDIKNILKYDCLVNLIVGARGVGKTYSSLNYAIENYKATGYGTIYLRRYKNELSDFETILNPVITNNNIQNIKYINKGKKFVDEKNDKTILKGMILSQGMIKKSQDFSNINLIIFDEFIIDKGNYNYIPNEFNNFNNFIETISRLREITENIVIKTIMLSNAASRNNPYFIGYKIPVIEQYPYIKNDLLVYKAENTGFIEAKKSTRWGRFIINNTSMYDYMMDGNFKDKKEFIIEKLPPQTKYLATLIYADNKIGLYKDLKENNIIFSKKINETSKTIFSLTKEDRTPDFKYLNKKSPTIQSILQYNDLGRIRFDDLKIQAIFFDILKLL